MQVYCSILFINGRGPLRNRVIQPPLFYLKLSDTSVRPIAIMRRLICDTLDSGRG